MENPELSALRTAGQVAGIGGISVVALMLVLLALVRRDIFPELAKLHAYRLLRIIVLSATGIFGLGVVAWTYATVNGAGKTGPEPPIVKPKPEDTVKIAAPPSPTMSEPPTKVLESHNASSAGSAHERSYPCSDGCEVTYSLEHPSKKLAIHKDLCGPAGLVGLIDGKILGCSVEESVTKLPDEWPTKRYLHRFQRRIKVLPFRPDAQEEERFFFDGFTLSNFVTPVSCCEGSHASGMSFYFVKDDQRWFFEIQVRMDGDTVRVTPAQ